MASYIGRTLGNYRIEALLGSGGMGQVFRAVHVHLRRPAAIKVMHTHIAADPRFQARFRQEARAIAALAHPHIVQIYEFGEFGEQDERGVFLAMELLTGGSLGSLLEAQPGAPLPLRRGLALVAQTAEALAYAHEQGMVHRDIKPDNLLLKPSRTQPPGEPVDLVKVCDFGLTRLADGSVMSLSGAILGTPAYMSPEQCQGHALDHRSDQYSLGVVLYEVATGRPPFVVKSATDAIFKHVSEAPPPPRQVQPDLPQEVEAIILRCLAKRPGERYASMREVAEAVRTAASTLALTDAPTPLLKPPMPVGSTVLDLQARSDAPIGAFPPSTTELAPATQVADRALIANIPPRFALKLDQTTLSVSPGMPMRVAASIVNQATSFVRLALEVEGVPAEWVSLSVPTVTLAPLGKTTVDLRIEVPPSAELRPAVHVMTVNLRSEDSADDQVTTHARLEALPLPPLTIEPNRVRDARRAEYGVLLRHDGELPEHYVFHLAGDDGNLSYRVEPEQVVLGAGEVASASLAIDMPPFFLGPARSHPFKVISEAEESARRAEATGIFRQTGLVPLWALAILAVVLIGVALMLSTLVGGAAGPRIDSVIVEPENPNVGQPVTVRWDVSGANGVDIRPLVFGLDPDDGEYTFSDGIDRGTPLTFVASNDDGDSEERLLLAAIEGTATPSPTESVQATATVTQRAPDTGTLVASPTRTRTPTATATASPTATPTATVGPSTDEPQRRPTPTNTPVPTPTNTPVPLPTNTPVPLPPPPLPTNTPVPLPPPPPTDTPLESPTVPTNPTIPPGG